MTAPSALLPRPSLPRTRLPLTSLPFFALLLSCLLPLRLDATVFTWIGEAPGSTNFSGDWSDPANWLPAGWPSDPGDAASITLGALDDFTVTLDVNATINEFLLNTAVGTFAASGRTFEVGNLARIQSGDVLWSGGTWSGNRLLNQSLITVRANSTFDFDTFDQEGTLRILGHAGATSAIFTSPTGFENRGTIELTSTFGRLAEFRVTDGTLHNTPGSTVRLATGAGGPRTWQADLDNRGDFLIETNATFSKTNGTFTNRNLLQIDEDATLSITGAGQVLTQAAGTLDIQGALEARLITFNFDGGILAGNPPILRDSTLNLAPESAGSGDFILRGNVTFNGDIHEGQSIEVQGSSTAGNAILTSPNGLTNHNLLVLTSIFGRRSELHVTEGVFTNPAGSTVRLAAGAGGERRWWAELENDGDFFIETNSTFSKTNGTFTNRNVLRIDEGATLSIDHNNQTLVQASGILDIQGALEVRNITFNFDGGVLAGNPPILRDSTFNLAPETAGSGDFILRGNVTLNGDINEGQSIEVQGTSTAGNAILTSPTGLTNHNLLVLTSVFSRRSELHVTEGVFTNPAGSTVRLAAGAGGERRWWAELENDGDFLIETNSSFSKTGGTFTNRSLLRIDEDATLSIAHNNQTLVQASGTFDIQGALEVRNITFTFDGGVLAGNRPLLRDSTLNLAPESAGSGGFILRGNVTLNGDIHEGQSIEVQGSSSAGNAILTSPTGLTNHNHLVLTSVFSRASELRVTEGLFTNAAGATLETVPGAGGQRNIRSDFENFGSLLVRQNTSFPNSNTSVINHGTVTIDDDLTLTINGTYTQEAGQTLLNNATLDSSGPVVINGGSLEGTGTVDASLDNAGSLIPGASPGRLAITGAYTQQAAGNLAVEVAGFTPETEHDLVAVTGSATLAGSIEVTLLDGFQPEFGDTFTILTAASVNGAFDDWNGAGLRPGRGWKVDTTPTSALLRVGPGIITFDNWLDEFYTAEERADPAIGGPNGDPGKTGINNLTRYFLGMTPWAPDQSLLPRPVVVTVESNGQTTRHLAFEFERRRLADGVSATYQFSQDMQSWTEAGLAEEILFVGNTMETVRIRVEEPIAEDANDAGFLRLVLTDARN